MSRTLHCPLGVTHTAFEVNAIVMLRNRHYMVAGRLLLNILRDCADCIDCQSTETELLKDVEYRIVNTEQVSDATVWHASRRKC